MAVVAPQPPVQPASPVQPVRLPTEDDLPYSDGMPMESQRHVLQSTLLIQPYTHYHAHRNDFFIGGNMFVYFSAAQLKSREFRGPDVFVVEGVPRRERKSWVVWEEGKGPDVVIELLSESTAEVDWNEKKRVYQNELRVPEYFLYDPDSGELAGFMLRSGVYEPIIPDEEGRLRSGVLNLLLVRWSGSYEGIPTHWLRWAELDGTLLPTPQERAEQERLRADEAVQRADEAVQRADEERRRADVALQRSEADRQRLNEESRRAERLAERLRALGVDLDE